MSKAKFKNRVQVQLVHSKSNSYVIVVVIVIVTKHLCSYVLSQNLTSEILSVHRNYTGEKVPTLLENIPTQGPEFSSGGSAPAEEISRTL